MKAKETARWVIFALFVLPSLLGVLWWATKAMRDPGNPQYIENGVELTAKEVIPWWLDILMWLAGLGTIGALLIIAFIWFLKRVGEIR